MIIVYNLSGLLVGLAGILVGFAAMLLSGSVASGLLSLAIVWIGLGLWWRKRPTDHGSMRPYPAIFFIPLPFLAVPLLFLSVFGFFAEKSGGLRRSDPRAVQLANDVKTLRAAVHGGDGPISDKVHEALAQKSDVDDWHVFSRLGSDSVLVLLFAPDLKKIEEPARAKMISAIEEVLEKEPRTTGKKRYLGIRGKYAFGAVRVSPDFTEIASLVSDDPLLAFYGTPPKEPDPAAGAKAQ